MNVASQAIDSGGTARRRPWLRTSDTATREFHGAIPRVPLAAVREHADGVLGVALQLEAHQHRDCTHNSIRYSGVVTASRATAPHRAVLARKPQNGFEMKAQREGLLHHGRSPTSHRRTRIVLRVKARRRIVAIAHPFRCVQAAQRNGTGVKGCSKVRRRHLTVRKERPRRRSSHPRRLAPAPSVTTAVVHRGNTCIGAVCARSHDQHRVARRRTK